MNNPALTPVKKPSGQLASIAASAGTPIAHNISSSLSMSSASIPLASNHNIVTKLRSNSSMSSLSVNTDDAIKYNSDDFANNKIFVGGLHYDTRDGKSFD